MLEYLLKEKGLDIQRRIYIDAIQCAIDTRIYFKSKEIYIQNKADETFSYLPYALELKDTSAYGQKEKFISTSKKAHILASEMHPLTILGCRNLNGKKEYTELFYGSLRNRELITSPWLFLHNILITESYLIQNHIHYRTKQRFLLIVLHSHPLLLLM